MSTSLVFEPIGVVHSPFTEKVSAPRQATAPSVDRAALGADSPSSDVEGTVELFPGRGLEHALEDLESWGRIWIVFVFHRVDGWRPKVLPPRSTKRRGVLATRSPHRPNPIGLSAVRLVGVEGLTLRIRDVDILDGSPVLDLKPYVPYADAFPDAGSGWLESVADPIAPTPVAWTDDARAQAEWLATHGVALIEPVERALALGAKPSAYRRIRPVEGGELELAVKEWRIRFRAQQGGAVLITSVRTGYRPRELATGTGESKSAALETARAFAAAFGVQRR